MFSQDFIKTPFVSSLCKVQKKDILKESYRVHTLEVLDMNTFSNVLSHTVEWAVICCYYLSKTYTCSRDIALLLKKSENNISH